VRKLGGKKPVYLYIKYQARAASPKKKHVRESASKHSGTQFAVAKKPENLLKEPHDH